MGMLTWEEPAAPPCTLSSCANSWLLSPACALSSASTSDALAASFWLSAAALRTASSVALVVAAAKASGGTKGLVAGCLTSSGAWAKKQIYTEQTTLCTLGMQPALQPRDGGLHPTLQHCVSQPDTMCPGCVGLCVSWSHRVLLDWAVHACLMALHSHVRLQELRVLLRCAARAFGRHGGTNLAIAFLHIITELCAVAGGV